MLCSSLPSNRVKSALVPHSVNKVPPERRLFPLWSLPPRSGPLLHSLNDRFQSGRDQDGSVHPSLVRLAIGKTRSLMPGLKQIAATLWIPGVQKASIDGLGIRHRIYETEYLARIVRQEGGRGCR